MNNLYNYYSFFWLFSILLNVNCQHSIKQLPERRVWKVITNIAENPEISIIEIKGMPGTGQTFVLQNYFQKEKSMKYIDLASGNNHNKSVQDLLNENYASFDGIYVTDAVSLVNLMNEHVQKNSKCKFAFADSMFSSYDYSNVRRIKNDNNNGSVIIDIKNSIAIRRIILPPLTLAESDKSVNGKTDILKAIRKGGLYKVQNITTEEIERYFISYFHALEVKFNRSEEILNFSYFKSITRLYFGDMYTAGENKKYYNNNERFNEEFIEKLTECNLIVHIYNRENNDDRKFYVMDNGFLWYILERTYKRDLKPESAKKYEARLIENLIFTELYYRLVIYGMENALTFIYYRNRTKECEIDFHLKFKNKIYIFEVQPVSFRKNDVNSKKLIDATKNLKIYFNTFHENECNNTGACSIAKIAGTYFIHYGETFYYNSTTTDGKSLNIYCLSFNDVGSIIDEIIEHNLGC